MIRALVAVLLLLAACGGAAPAASSPPPSTSASATRSESEADGDLGRFAVALDGDNRMTLTLLDTTEVGTADAAIHRLFAVALFASAPFVRAP